MKKGAGSEIRTELSLDAARFLVSAEGRALAEAFDESSEKSSGKSGPGLFDLENLRKKTSAEFARAIFDQAVGRSVLAKKHTHARLIATTRLAAEQSSSEIVAAHRARRFSAAPCVFEIGCGVGLDTAALAQTTRVFAVDRDLGRIVLARANVAVLAPAGKAHFVRGDERTSVRGIAWLFADPDRRAEGSRTIDPEEGSPPLSKLLAVPGISAGAIKLAPAAALDRIETLGELEFISAKGELKEICLWFGDAKSASRRISLPEIGFSTTGKPSRGCRPASHVDYLLEPDPALIRSGLLGQLAEEIDAGVIEPDIAYLASGQPVIHPLFKTYPVRACLDGRARSVREWLDANDSFAQSAARRGFAIEPEEFLKSVGKTKGSSPCRLFLTKRAGRPCVIVATAQVLQAL